MAHTLKYVDTHCHLDLYENPNAVLKAAECSGTVTVAVTELPSAFLRLVVRFGNKKSLRPALGFHPLKATSSSPLEMALFGRLLDRCDFVGEIGLDGSRVGKGSLRTQIRIFEHLLEQPRIRSKILTVHSRGAEKQTIERLSQADVSAILHWYSGPLNALDVALDAGLWFSVNPAMLRSKNGRKIISRLPPDRVLTETDGPYTKISTSPSQPCNIPDVIAELAKHWNRSERETQLQVWTNMSNLAAEANARGT